MAVEAPGLWKDLNAAWPEDDDDCPEGDNHIRVVKESLTIQFPNLEAVVSVTADELNSTTGATAGNPLQAQITTLDTAVQALVALVDGGVYAIGDVKLRASAVAEPNWLLCDGALYDPATYPDLFTLLSTQFGGDGVTTFGVPDLRGRSPMGFGQGDTAQGGGTGASRAFATKVGADTHTLTTPEMPSHTHAINNAASAIPGGGATVATGGSLGQGVVAVAEGGGGAHNNVSPVAVLGFYIKAL